jgi:hypothetical protein
VYDRNIDNKTLTFGVSGLLYKSNLLMYDHQTRSLWSQVRKEAVTGPMTGAKLTVLSSTVTTWEKWKKRFPETEVLSLNTGYSRNYDRDPYENYYKSKRGLFSFFKKGPREEMKQLVAGITINGKSKAYPIDLLRGQAFLSDHVGSMEIRFFFDRQTGVLTIKDSKNNVLSYITAYWFVWKGLHPQSELYQIDEGK